MAIIGELPALQNFNVGSKNGPSIMTVRSVVAQKSGPWLLLGLRTFPKESVQFFRNVWALSWSSANTAVKLTSTKQHAKKSRIERIPVLQFRGV
jgi:hypothetical protein